MNSQLDRHALRLIEKLHELGLRKKSSGQMLSKLADNSLTSAVSGTGINALRSLYLDPNKSGEHVVLQSASSNSISGTS